VLGCGAARLLFVSRISDNTHLAFVGQERPKPVDSEKDEGLPVARRLQRRPTCGDPSGLLLVFPLRQLR
jgi:hypothetical protein